MRKSLQIVAAALALGMQPLCAATPPVDALAATKIATNYLAKLGPSAPHIVSVVLETSSIVNGTKSWMIRWSDPISSGKDKEVGIRVRFDGSVARLIEGQGSRKKKQGVTPGFY